MKTFLALLIAFSACASPPPPPHAPANTTDDDGYLVNTKSALTITSGIPFPWRCYNGFDPYNHPVDTLFGSYGLCDFQPRLNPSNIPWVRVCDGNPPHGWVELSNNNSNLPPGSYCAQVQIAGFPDGSYLPASSLAVYGWKQDFDGDAQYSPLHTRIARALLGPDMSLAYSNSPTLTHTSRASNACFGVDTTNYSCGHVHNRTGAPVAFTLPVDVVTNALYITTSGE